MRRLFLAALLLAACKKRQPSAPPAPEPPALMTFAECSEAARHVADLERAAGQATTPIDCGLRKTTPRTGHDCAMAARALAELSTCTGFRAQDLLLDRKRRELDGLGQGIGSALDRDEQREEADERRERGEGRAADDDQDADKDRGK